MIEDDDVSDALKCLAQMTMFAPAYSLTVMPFSDAHQNACVILERLQNRGFEEAGKGDWREFFEAKRSK